MKKTVGCILLGVFFSMAILGCQASPNAGASKDVLFQYSTLSSLLAGVYDGDMTFAEVKQHGDFGLGTFNILDGEMIEIDNQVYQVKADGVAYKVADDMKTPFSVVTYFDADQTVTLDEPMDCAQLKEYIDSLLPTENIAYAIKIDGTFSYMKTRSVPSQSKPYRTLLEVLAEQAIFEFDDVSGDIVGFRLPSYMDGANAPGYHFHFINKARDAGGHVLDCQVQNAKIEIDYTHEWATVLPEDAEFYNVVLSSDEYQ